MKIFPLISTVFVVTLIILSPARDLRAMGSGDSTGSSGATTSSAYNKGVKAIEAKSWDQAIAAFKIALAEKPDNADTLNYLGYSHRQKGDYDNAFAYYQKALAINQNHRGANEYIGEAYLKTGNLEKAEEHLARLDAICTFGCAEYTLLKRRIAEYKATQ